MQKEEKKEDPPITQSQEHSEVSKMSCYIYQNEEYKYRARACQKKGKI